MEDKSYKTPSEQREKQLKALERLLDIMDDLRAKCPWDRKQTLESLRPQTIEETYELSDAILKEDLHNICKELGDRAHDFSYKYYSRETNTQKFVDIFKSLEKKDK